MDGVVVNLTETGEEMEEDEDAVRQVPVPYAQLTQCHIADVLAG